MRHRLRYSKQRTVREGLWSLTLSSRDIAPINTVLPPNASPLGRLRNQVLNALIDRVVLREVKHHLNYVRWTLGLGPLQQPIFEVISPFLYLAI